MTDKDKAANAIKEHRKERAIKVYVRNKENIKRFFRWEQDDKRTAADERS